MSNAVHSGSRPSNASVGLAPAWERLCAQDLVSPVLGGSLSVKEQAADSAGRLRDVLFFRDGLAAAEPLAVLRQDVLRPLGGLDGADGAALSFELERARLDLQSGHASGTALLHAALPHRTVCLSTHPAFLALGAVVNWKQRVSEVLGQQVVLIPFEHGLGLVKSVREAVPLLGNGRFSALYLRYHGLLVFADDLDALDASLSRFLECALSTGAAMVVEPVPAASQADASLRVRLALIRQQVAQQVGQAVLLRFDDGVQARNWALSPDSLKLLEQGAPDAVTVDRTITPPVEVPEAGQPVSIKPDMAQRARQGRSLVLVDPAVGLGVTAATPAALGDAMALLHESLHIMEASSRLGLFDPVKSGEGSSLAPQPDPERHMFAGEIALVTGAASGIGKACVDSLLARGAAVVGLDIHESILHVAAGPQYMGQVCDLTDEQALIAALEKAVRVFGGLDMLVLNAGVFPSSCNLDALALEHWQKVMRINLDVNVTLLREAFPLLKAAPRYGRVVINSSRNVPAPGPGAAAYSASKAALTQLGRVAALEWGKTHIRVNMINPHAVFDTGIWTDEVLKSRAAKYGLTVQEYKTNNVLGVELTSHDVGELVAEMCGPLFSKITGAQVPMDGGSDRVI